MSSSPYNDLQSKAESLFLEYLQSKDDPGCNMYRFADAEVGDEVAEPYVAVLCPESVPFEGDGIDASAGITNEIVSVEIRISSRAAEDVENLLSMREAHTRLRGRVKDALNQTDLVAQLNALGQVPGIAVDQVDRPGCVAEVAGRSYVSRLRFAVICHGT